MDDYQNPMPPTGPGDAGPGIGGLSGNESAVGWGEIRQAITPLRLVFWGGLLCLFDITFSETHNGEGFKFDILNDTLGAILITVGVFRLAAIRVDRPYASWLALVQAMSVVLIIDTIRDHFIVQMPQVVVLLGLAVSLAYLAAILAFCWCMRRLCLAAALARAADSWRVTIILFVVIFVAPLGLFYLAAIVAIVTESSFHINLGPAGLLLLPVLAIPIIHLFVSTSRMKRAAEGA